MKINRISGILIVGLVLSSLTLGYGCARREGPLPLGQYLPSQWPINLIFEEKVQPNIIEQPCNKGEDNRKSDLCAQWKAADAAEKSAYWTQAAFWLGTIGLAVGALTLWAAWRAANYASKAANAAIDAVMEAKKTTVAAEKSVDVAMSTLEAESRPILKIIPPDVISCRFVDNFAVIEMILKVQNVGSSLAHRVAVQMTAIHQTLLAAINAEDERIKLYSDTPLERAAIGIFPNEIGIVKDMHSAELHTVDTDIDKPIAVTCRALYRGGSGTSYITSIILEVPPVGQWPSSKITIKTPRRVNVLAS